MQGIKDILEKIERPRNKDELVPAWWIRDKILTFVDQALAKLKEEPEPGEFTKNIMANLERWDIVLAKKEDIRIRTVIDWLKESLVIIDQLQAENEQLKGEKPIPFAWWKDCPRLAQKTMERVIERNDELFAENKKLVEGQKAKKEAGS